MVQLLREISRLPNALNVGLSIGQLYHGLRGSKSLDEQEEEKRKKPGRNLERKFFHFGPL